MDRRQFLIEALKKSGQVALASTAIYSASTFLKEALPDASMVAGAKTCGWMTIFAGNEGSCPTSIPTPPSDCYGTGETWSGCTVPTSFFGTAGIYEEWTCFCN